MLYPTIVFVVLLIASFCFGSPLPVCMGAAFFLGAYQVFVTRKPRTDLVALTRKYAMEIRNGRQTRDIYSHFLSEVEELRVEINGGNGEDGVVGESIDSILCLLDLIIIGNPNLTDDQIREIAVKKLEKWKLHYSDRLVRDR